MFRSKILRIFLLIMLAGSALACVVPEPPQVETTHTEERFIEPTEPPAPYAFLFDELLADGFDFPIGNADGKGSYTDKTSGKSYNGWYIATHTAEEYSLGVHTGEDWNGIGGGNSDLGQPVYATAKGEVIAADDYGFPWGNVIMVRHRYLENGQVKTVLSQYAHLQDMQVAVGDVVDRRQPIGTIGTGDGAYPAHLHFEIRKSSMEEFAVDYWPSSNGKDQQWVKDHYEEPSAFIKAHRKLLLPVNQSDLLVVFKSRYELLHFGSGELKKRYEIALSQNPNGHKERQGDNRLPEGEYTINQKSRGPFEGAMGPFFGPAWMRLSYPNVFDAESGVQRGVISQAECDRIKTAHKQGKMPPKTTDLGGGIGIHGWNGQWSNDGHRDLTWGCISMHNTDLDAFYDEAPKGTTILIYP